MVKKALNNVELDVFFYLLSNLCAEWKTPFKGVYNERQRFVVEMFQHAWKGYKETAWGHDHSHPISRRYDDWFNVGLTILDALDTTIIMGLKNRKFHICKCFLFHALVDKNLIVSQLLHSVCVRLRQLLINNVEF